MLRIDIYFELCNESFDSYCNECGIQRHKTIRSNPQQNEVAKKMNKTLMNKARCTITKKFWDKVVMTTMYLKP